MMLHTIGSYYTYSKMPLFELFTELFDLSRNHYDRLIHFLFGAVFYVPPSGIRFQKTKHQSHLELLDSISYHRFLYRQSYEIIEYLAVVVTNDNMFAVVFRYAGRPMGCANDILAGTLGAGTSWAVSKMYGKK